MSILITGGLGFLGSNLTATLLGEGHEVVVVDNLITGTRENALPFNDNPRFRFLEMSINDADFLVELGNCEQYHFSQIYHLACPTGVPNIRTLGEEMMDTCSVGTKNVLQLALLHQAKVLFTSSSEVYGNPEVSPQAESYTGNVDPQGPRANYEEGKRFSEALLAMFVEKYGLCASTVRLFNVYGPNMSLSDTRVIPRFVTQALRGDPLTLHGNGDQQRTLCYVSDVVAGLKLIMDKGRSGEIYNLGSAKAITMSELAEIILAATGTSSKIVSVTRQSHDHEHRIPSLEKINELGWKPSTSLTKGLKLTIADFAARLSIANEPEGLLGLQLNTAT